MASEGFRDLTAGLAEELRDMLNEPGPELVAIKIQPFLQGALAQRFANQAAPVVSVERRKDRPPSQLAQQVLGKLSPAQEATWRVGAAPLVVGSWNIKHSSCCASVFQQEREDLRLVMGLGWVLIKTVQELTQDLGAAHAALPPAFRGPHRKGIILRGKDLTEAEPLVLVWPEPRSDTEISVRMQIPRPVDHIVLNYSTQHGVETTDK